MKKLDFVFIALVAMFLITTWIQTGALSFCFGTIAVMSAIYVWARRHVIKKEQKEQHRQEMADVGEVPVCVLKGKHVSGLSTAVGSDCRLAAWVDYIELDSAGRKYRIAMDKVHGVEIFMEKEAMQEFHMRPGRAIAGGLLFGPVGAIIGGMPKSDSMKAKDRMFFVLNYERSSGQEDFILMESPDFSARKCVERISRYISGENMETIDL